MQIECRITQARLCVMLRCRLSYAKILFFLCLTKRSNENDGYNCYKRCILMKAEALTAERCPIHFKEGILWVIRNGHRGIVIQK